MVLECSGEFLTREKLQAYFDQGVKKVIVSAPVKDAKDPVLNIVYGVNHSEYDKNVDHIVTKGQWPLYDQLFSASDSSYFKKDWDRQRIDNDYP